MSRRLVFIDVTKPCDHCGVPATIRILTSTPDDATYPDAILCRSCLDRLVDHFRRQGRAGTDALNTDDRTPTKLRRSPAGEPFTPPGLLVV